MKTENKKQKTLDQILTKFGLRGQKNEASSTNEAKSKAKLERYQQFLPEIDRLEEEIQEILDYLYSIYSIYAQSITAETSTSDGGENVLNYIEYAALVDVINQSLDLAYKAMREFPNKGFEEFVAFYLRELSKLSVQAHDGSNAETPWVAKKKMEVWSSLESGKHVLLIGETGTGKTRLAKELAKIWNEGELLLVSGSGFTTVRDFTSSIGLGEPVDLHNPNEISSAIAAFNERLEKMDGIDPGLRTRIMAIFDEGLSSKVPITIEILSPVLKAYREGKTVIIDEITFIPAQVTAVIYDMLADENAINKGFRVIFTGNFGEKYSGLARMNPAFWNRIGSVIEYQTLPLDERVKSLSQSILDADSENEPPARDLYQLALSFLAGKDGAIYGPIHKEETSEFSIDDLLVLDKIWNLVQAFAVLQDSFSGKKPIKLDNNKEYFLKKSSLSIRQLKSITESWKREAFHYELDVYIYESIVRPALAIDKQEALVIFDLLKNNHGFFEDKRWAAMRSMEDFQPYDKEDFVTVCLQESHKLIDGELTIVPATHKIGIYPVEAVAEAFSGMKPLLSKGEQGDDSFTSNSERISLDVLETTINFADQLISAVQGNVLTDGQLETAENTLDDLNELKS